MKIRVPNVVKKGLGNGYALRPASFEGLRVGFLDGWGSEDGLGMFPAMEVIAKKMKEEHGAADVVWQKKPSISKAVPDDELKAFAAGVDVVVNGEGLCGSCTAASILDAINLEALGKPTITIVQDRFEPSARFHGKNLGLPDLFLYVESAPASGSVQQDNASDVQNNWGTIERALIGQQVLEADSLAEITAPSSPVLEIATPEDWERLVEEGRWSDGLPVAISSDEAVQKIIDHLGRDPQELVTLVPPTYGMATIEQIAIQCAMAGCLPEYVPVVLAALDALMDPEFNLHGTLCTTHPGAPQVIVSGPIVDELDFNTSNSAHGGSGRANGAIGRAIRLIVRNIGGQDPTINDMDPLGGPHKYAACVAERRAGNPLGSINGDRGFADDENIVTVVSVPGPYPAVTNGTAERTLALLANGFTTATVQMYSAGGQALFTLSMKPARALANAGYTRDDIRQYILEHAYLTPGELKKRGVMQGPFTDIAQIYWGENSLQDLRIDVETAADDTHLPLFTSIDDIQLLVTGGDSQFFSAFQPNWGRYGGSFVSRKIQR